MSCWPPFKGIFFVWSTYDYPASSRQMSERSQFWIIRQHYWCGSKLRATNKGVTKKSKMLLLNFRSSSMESYIYWILHRVTFASSDSYFLCHYFLKWRTSMLLWVTHVSSQRILLLISDARLDGQLTAGHNILLSCSWYFGIGAAGLWVTADQWQGAPGMRRHGATWSLP